MLELTKTQQEHWDLYETHNRNFSKAAKKAGISRQVFTRSINATKAKRAKSGVTDSFDVSDHVGEGYAVKGMSSLVDNNGDAKLRWIKTDKCKERQLEALRVFVEALKEDIKPYKPIKLVKKKRNKDLLNMYLVTDVHLGMYSWEPETGADYDLKIAEKLLTDWQGAAMAQSPDSQDAILCNLGDFFQCDSINPVTPGHGNVLDADSRYAKVLEVGTRVLRRMVAMLLEKHERVFLFNVSGNHDDTTGICIRQIMSVAYENEPRVIVDVSPDKYHCHEFGKTSLFWHHGDKRSVANCAEVFAAKFRSVFGRTEFSYGHLGHKHSVHIKEGNLMTIEQHSTLAAPDAYCSRGGWMSKRSASVITYHKEYGEVGRTKISYEMIKDGY